MVSFWGQVIEKTNKKTIWFDFIKQLMLIETGDAEFGLLVVPTCYPHARSEWNLYSEAIDYRKYLGEYAGLDGKKLGQLVIIGYGQEVKVGRKWLPYDSDQRRKIRARAEIRFGKSANS